MFKNMKIEINEQQPLDVVVSELERLGYYKTGCVGYPFSPYFIISNSSGFYTDHLIAFGVFMIIYKQ